MADDNAEGTRQNIRNELDIIFARLILGALEQAEARLARAPRRRELIHALTRKPTRGGGPPTLEGLLSRFRSHDVRGAI